MNNLTPSGEADGPDENRKFLYLPLITFAL